MTTVGSYRFGPFTVDAGSYRLFRGLEVIPLSPKIIDLLLYLVARQSALVPKDEFHWRSGVEQIAEFVSSEHGRRMFCRNCGTTLGCVTSRRPTFMHLAAGTLDRAPRLRIGLHAYTASKAPWFEITDALPQHEGEPTQRG